MSGLRLRFMAGLCLGGGCLALPRLQAGDTDPAPDPLQAAVLAVQDDIERDTAELIRQREQIAAQRAPLADRRDALQAAVRAQRAEAARLRQLQPEGENRYDTLSAATAALETDCRFLTTVFEEYARAMETRVGTAEGVPLAGHLRALRSAASEAPLCESLAVDAGALLAFSAAWNEQRLGGRIFEGVALDAHGTEHSGRFASFGPVAYFAATNGPPAGLAVTQFGTDQPTVLDDAHPAVTTGILNLLDGQAARLPLDVTAGDALKLREARTGYLEHAKKGGFVMIPLLGVGVLAVILILWKSVELGTIRIRGDESIRQTMALARTGDLAGADRQRAHIREPLASLVAAAIRHRAAPRAHLEEILHEHVLGCLPRLERTLGILAVLGGIAPLLGLLGTVTGMIHTFQLVTVFGSGDARLLSGGISEALVTTEFGLVIAIPVLLAHAFLARRARSIVGVLERTAVSMVNDLTVPTDET